MKIQRATLSTCHTATGAVVVIDVLRAFTTAAFLFDAGVREVILASGVDEAFRLRERMPECLILGEVDGIPVPGFDLGNSPFKLGDHDLRGRRIIQRTSAGTQGVVRAAQAQTVLTASLVNASATARYIRKLAPDTVTLIQTGLFLEAGAGDEDVACADVLEAKLLGKTIDLEMIARRVRGSYSGSHYDGSRPDFPPQDLEMALAFDRFSFAMPVERENGLHVMHAAHVPV